VEAAIEAEPISVNPHDASAIGVDASPMGKGKGEGKIQPRTACIPFLGTRRFGTTSHILLRYLSRSIPFPTVPPLPLARFDRSHRTERARLYRPSNQHLRAPSASRSFRRSRSPPSLNAARTSNQYSETETDRWGDQKSRHRPTFGEQVAIPNR